MDAKIIEQSETPEGRTIATIKTTRGEEYSVDVDKAVTAIVTLLSDRRNELRGGWELGTGWYVQELDLLQSRSVVAVHRPR